MQARETCEFITLGMRQAQKCPLPLRHPCDGGVFKYAECLEWESFPSKELQLQLKIIQKYSEAREVKTECDIVVVYR